MRFFALIQSAFYLMRERGISSLLLRLFAWLRGERGYVNTLIDEAHGRIVVKTYQDFQRWFEPPRFNLSADDQPTFDILCLLDSDAALKETLASLQAQTCDRWRLLVISKTTEHPLSFQTLEEAAEAITADYVMWLEPGDQLVNWAFEAFTAAVKDRPDVVYCDADDIGRHKPLFKPDWSPTMMLSVNLLRESIVKTSLALPHLNALPDTREYGFRIAEAAKTIRHIPHVLMHRCQPETPDPDAIKRHLIRTGIVDPQVSIDRNRVRVTWQPVKAGLASIIIPSKDKADLLGKCLDSIFEKTQTPRYEVIVVDTGSVEPETAALYERYAGRIKIVEYREPFNFSKACNVGANAASGDLLLFLNNDIEVVEGDWLARMAQWFDLPETGAVGAKLLFPDGRIQHAGVFVGLHSMADNLLAFSDEGYDGPYGSDDWYRDILAVTGACVMVSRRLFDQIKGFNENFILIFSDVFLCLDIFSAGYRVIYSPDVRLLHHESATRSRDQSAIPPGDLELARSQLAPWLKRGNPYFSRNLSFRHIIPTFRQAMDDTPTGKPYED